MGGSDPDTQGCRVKMAKSLSYRFGDELLDSPKFSHLKDDVVAILKATPVPTLARPKERRRGGRTWRFSTDQIRLNACLDRAFGARGWDVHPYIVERERFTKLQADYKKERVQVEVQWGNMARWYTDVFKFQVSYSLGHIDIGVLVTATQHFAATIDEARLAGDPVIEARRDHPRLRGQLKHGLLRPAQVATEVAPHVFLPPTDSDGERGAAIEALRRERPERLPHDPRPVRRLPSCARLRTAWTTPRHSLSRGRSRGLLGAARAHDPHLDTRSKVSKRCPKRDSRLQVRELTSGGGEIRTPEGF